MNKALLDTDIDSEILKAVNPTVARNAIAYRRAQGVLTRSAVTVMEVIRGFGKKQSLRRLQDFLSAVASEEVLIFDQPAAELAGQIAGDLDRAGRPVGTGDPMMAAIALTHRLELVTGNTTHFQYVQNLGYPLTLVNWRSRSRPPPPLAPAGIISRKGRCNRSLGQQEFRGRQALAMSDQGLIGVTNRVMGKSGGFCGWIGIAGRGRIRSMGMASTR